MKLDAFFHSLIILWLGLLAPPYKAEGSEKHVVAIGARGACPVSCGATGFVRSKTKCLLNPFLSRCHNH